MAIALVYDRKTHRTAIEEKPTGVMGQISYARLCETLESCGEVRAPERITHLIFDGDFIKYRVERDKDEK